MTTKPRHDTGTAQPTPHSPDEPEITQEESVPVDRRDTEGEKLMDQLGRERRKSQED